MKIRRDILRIFFAGVIAISTSAAMAKPKAPAKDTVITSNRLEYDYTESAVIFEDNVRVEDEQYTLTADRVLVLMEGTNEVQQIRALGHVVVINGDRTARCPEAVYTKKTGQIVMRGENDTSVQLTNKDDQIWGRIITIWLDDQRMECIPARLNLSGGNPAKVEGKDRNGEPKRVLP